MTDTKSTEELFDEAEDKFVESEDAETLKGNRELFDKAKTLSQFRRTKAGEILVGELKDNITRSLLALIETREGRHISDLDASFKILTKLISAEGQEASIADWLGTL